MVMPCSRSAARPSTSSAKSSSPPCVPCALASRASSAASWSSKTQLRVVQQAADQRALAVVDAAAGDEAQQALVSGRQRSCVRDAIRSSLPASSSPSRRPGRGRSRGPARSEVRAASISRDDLRQRVGVALDRAGQRIAAERAEAHRAHLRLSRPARSGMRSSSTMISVPSRSTTGRSAREVERHDRDRSRAGCTARRRARSSSRAGTRGSLSPLRMRAL